MLEIILNIFAELNNLKFIIPIFICIIALLVAQFCWVKKVIYLLVGKYNRRKFLLNFSLTKKTIKLILLALGFSAISIALLRPQWHVQEELLNQNGRDLLIALDISRSMLAQDVKPNRLEFAKDKIKKIINNLESNRVGLIIFSGEAFIQCPLTSDISAVFTFLDAIDTETISSGATALDAPIKKAVELFNSIAAKKHKLLVILTDGEDFSKDLSSIKEQAKNINLKIFTFGIGTESGAPIPIFDNNGNLSGYQKDKDSSIVISKLNEPLLETLSNQTEADYIKSEIKDTDVKALVNKVLLFEKEKFEEKKLNILQEQYHYFAMAGLTCLLFEWLL